MSLVDRFRDKIKSALGKINQPKEVVEKRIDEIPVPPVQPKKEELVLTVTNGTILRIALLVIIVVIGSRLISNIVDVLLLVLISIIIAAAVQPTIDKFEAKGWPRVVTALIVFIIGLGILSLMLIKLIPIVAEQILDLSKNVTNIVDKLINEGPQTLPLIGPSLQQMFGNVDPATLSKELQEPLQELGKSMLSFTTNAVGAAGRFAIGLFDFVAILVISFYMVIRGSNIDRFIKLITPQQFRPRTLKITNTILVRMGAWLRAQLLVMLFAFILSWIGFAAIGLRYSLFLALLAGIFSIIPVVGWITAGILATLLAITQSAWIVFGAIIIVIIVHFAEAYIFIPLVTERAVGLSPVAVIISLLFGAKLAGLLGILLAVPVATALTVLFEELNNGGSKDKSR